MTRSHTLTPEKHRHFLACLVTCKGLIKPAAAKAGIGYRTVRDWIDRGESGEEPFATLVEEMHRIRGDKAGHWLNQLERISEETAGPQSVAATQLLLSYLMPDTFGEKSLKNAGIAEGVQAVIDAVQPLMSEGAYGELIRAIAALSGHGRVDQVQTGGATHVADAEGESVDERALGAGESAAVAEREGEGVL